MKNPKKIVTFNTSYCERSNMNKEKPIVENVDMAVKRKMIINIDMKK